MSYILIFQFNLHFLFHMLITRVIEFILIYRKLPMKLAQLFPKIPYLLVIYLIFYFTTLYIDHKPELGQELWHYYISNQQFQTHHQTNDHIKLQLQHEGQGHYQPIEIQIITKSQQQKRFILDDLNHTHIDEKLNIHKHQIKHAIIKSNHPLNFNQKQNVRLLASVTMNDLFIQVCGKFFSFLFPFLRNLILIGIFINQIDTFLPIVMTFESVLMFAFLDNQKHYLYEFFNGIFNSKIDLFNAIRLTMFSNSSSTGNNLLTQYGFSSNLFTNISGQFMVLIIFLMMTIFIKAGAAFLKFQRLRGANSRLRGIWNGFLFCLMPRFLVFGGFSLRQCSFKDFEGTFYPLIAVVFYIVYFVYFIQLFLQIRRINQKVEYVEESRNQIGLVSRLDFKHDFQFDCLEYSNLYYPIMNYWRFLLFFVPIGMSFDFAYASFGGTIAAQLFYIMFTVSSSGYVKSRDSLVYPLCDFLLMLLQLSHIAVGLAQSVLHSQVSVIAQKVFFSLLMTITTLIICSLSIDLSQKIRQSWNKTQQKQDFVQDKELKTTKTRKIYKKKSAQKKQDTKTTFKNPSKQSDQVSLPQSQEDHTSQNDQSGTNFKKYNTQVRPKIRKVRQGKII